MLRELSIWKDMIVTFSRQKRGKFFSLILLLIKNMFDILKNVWSPSFDSSTSGFQNMDKYSVADPGFSKWGGAVLSQMGGRTSCFQVKSA